MNSSNAMIKKNSMESRELELSQLKSKIINAIRFSERYWMIYKEQTFGIATIIDLTYKKSYIEVLLSPNIDVLQKGIPLVKVFTPGKTIFNFNEILIDPDFDDDGLVSPIKIIERLNRLIKKEINYHLTILKYEIELINEQFENYPIESNPYFRKVISYFPNYVVEVRINLENYPEVPSLSEKNQLIIRRFMEPIGEKLKGKLAELYGISAFERYGEEIKIYDDELDVFIEKSKIPFLMRFKRRFWEKVREFFRLKPRDYIEEYKDLERIFLIKEKDFSNIEIIKSWSSENAPHIVEVIESILEIKKDSQHLVLKNVFLEGIIHNISFKVHRGQSIGIYYELEGNNDSFIKNPIIDLYNTITGINPDYSGEISVFGTRIIPNLKNKIDGTYIINSKTDSKIVNMKIKKAILHDLYLIGKRKSKKSLVHRALEITGLLHRKNEIISKLTLLEQILFSISRALLRRQSIIMVSIPFLEIGSLESEQFNRYIENIKQEFHVILIIHGPKNIISNCDKIVTIKNKEVEIGTIKHFISKIPQAGEIITIELDKPDKIALDNMLKIDTVIFIEERKNERYKIYCIDENSNKVLIKLFESIGDYIYNFKIHKASLEEYLEFMEIKERVK
ncbi:MAG: hypothetical protein ACFFHV_06285 [Promethearchaeota archaeon]